MNFSKLINYKEKHTQYLGRQLKIIMNFFIKFKYLSLKEIRFIFCCIVPIIASCTATKTQDFPSTAASDLVCLNFLNNCLNLEKFTEDRLSNHFFENNKAKLYIEFPKIINLEKFDNFSNSNNLSKTQQRELLQKLASKLNSDSLKRYLGSSLAFPKSSIQKIKLISVNNSALIYFSYNTEKSDTKTTKKISRNELDIVQSTKISNHKSDTITIALIDSGVSTHHEKLKSLSVTQYNPASESFELKDTALGHGTGILSILAQNDFMHSPAPNIQFLSCNGLVGGKYDYLKILQCFDWLFMQSSVDVAVNAWLVNQPGCNYEWIYPLQMLWSSNTIPVFAVGNYGERESSDYSPANLSPFNSVPLVTVGALATNKQKLKSSSFGVSQCRNQRQLPTIMASGENLRVAVPFTMTSYQKVQGSSYSVAFVGRTFAYLRHLYPNRSIEDIVNAVLYSAVDLNIEGPDALTGFGELNVTGAIEWLKLNQ